MPRYLLVKEVAKILRRHPRTIYRWIDEKFIRAKKVRDGYLIPDDEIQRLLNEK